MYQSLIKPLFADIKKFALNVLFPIRCVVCEKEGLFLCADCQNKLTPLPLQYCVACQKTSPFGLTHPKCISPHTADALVSIFDYHDENVGKIIIAGKYKFIPAIFEILGNLIAKKFVDGYPSILSEPYTLTPIPLHSWRKRWRGFNQAEILSQTIGKELNLLCTTVLVRCHWTMTQKNLKKERRLLNVRNAFALSPKILRPCLAGRQAKSEILNQNFILVDDVCTTGATLAEAARVLKRNGADKVICLTVARD